MTTQDTQIPEGILDAAKAIAEQPWLTRAERDRMTLQIAKAILAERQRCAEIAYRVCAETRHVTLGDKVSEAIRGEV